MSDVLNFAGMSERQQLRYLQQQAEAAANPQPVEGESTALQQVFLRFPSASEPAPPKKKKRKKVPKPAEKEFVVEAILDKQICPDTVQSSSVSISSSVSSGSGISQIFSAMEGVWSRGKQLGACRQSDRV